MKAKSKLKKIVEPYKVHIAPVTVGLAADVLMMTTKAVSCHDDLARTSTEGDFAIRGVAGRGVDQSRQSEAETQTIWKKARR
jgi:hypothetical protein